MLTLNIIPPELKKQIHLKNIYKKIVNYFFFLLFTIIFYGIVLFLVVFVLKTEYKNTANNANLTTKDAANYVLQAKDINIQIDQIEEIQNEIVNWSDFIIKLINYTNNGIQIKSISLSKKNESLIITGFSDTRDNLLLFKQTLTDADFLENINLPIENLLEKDNINFNITAKITSYEFE